jgi:hypothetical protein
MVALGRKENLRLVFKANESLAVNYSVAVTLKTRAHRTLFFLHLSAFTVF